MAYIKSLGKHEENVPSVMARYPEQNVGLYKLTEQVMRAGECSFTDQQRELIGAFTSGTNNCTFCYNSHARTAMEFGLEEAFIEDLIRDIETSPVEESLKPVLRYVKKLTQSPSKVVQSDVDAILEAGWTENDFHFVVMICALFNFYNRLMDGYGCVGTPEHWAMSGKMLASQGYDLSKWTRGFGD
ncbi:MAG: carboxymuconolactone decarboxylase family protein [Sphingomonadales bacterium]